MQKKDSTIFIPLTRKRNIPLFAYGVSRADSERFAALIMTVWEQPSFKWRRFMLNGFRQHTKRFKDFPIIAVYSIHRWKPQQEKLKYPNSLAFFHGSTGFHFCWDLIKTEDIEGIQSIIMHEFCHFEQYLLAEPDGKIFLFDNDEAMERHCNLLVTRNGLNGQRLNENRNF